MMDQKLVKGILANNFLQQRTPSALPRFSAVVNENVWRMISREIGWSTAERTQNVSNCAH